MKLLFTEHNINPETPGILQKEGHEVFIPKENIPGVHEFDRDSLLHTIKRIQPDALVVGLKFKIDDEITQSIKTVFTRTTGLDHITSDVKVISLRGSDLSDVRAVPELSLAMCIYMMRTLYVPGYELNGKSVGIIGYGRLGRLIEQLMNGFGARVYHADKGESLDDVLKCQVIFITVTANEENRGMIGLEQFKLMEACPFVLNPSRSWLVKDVQEALDQELISGYWTDFDMPFKHPKMITTPHLGGNTFESAEKTERILVNKILEYGVHNM